MTEIKVECVTRKRAGESERKLRELINEGWRLVSVDQDVAYLTRGEEPVGAALLGMEKVLPKNPCLRCMSGWISLGGAAGLTSCHDGCKEFKELMALLGRKF